MEPELIADYECHTGEGPLWHPGEGRLYWVDIPNGRLFRYDPAADEHELAHERDGAIGGFTLQADGSLLLFEERGRVEIWDGGATETVIESIDGEADSRFNDVIADPEGRVFCGTMPAGDDPGSLYRLDPDGSLSTVEDAVWVSNGLGFTADLGSLYYTESREKTIYRYDYDRATGAPSNREAFVEVADEGIPDGMTVDARGHVWSARWDGGCLVHYDDRGTEIERVDFPARKVSSVVFGGRGYLDAYVTTALAGGTKDEEGAGAGALFRVDLGVRGVPEFRSRIGL